MSTILIVDDEVGIRRMYTKLLQYEGFDVESASTAEYAIQVMDCNLIDLVLLDINMPGMNGKVFFEYIHEHSPEIKVIVTSVYQVDDQKRMMPDASDYHDKAQNNDALISKIKALLNTV
ncbi:MAG: DNA-binding NtrC family response regulator [Candidatus Omnitrophota bacterium]|jgi:DNA-binding NtrC family response regulator